MTTTPTTIVIRPSHDPSRRERFEATVLVHLDAACNLARWLLRDATAADDVVQEASLKALRSFDALQGPSARAWFMAIVRNACMDMLADVRRSGRHESFDESSDDAVLLDHTGHAATPESLAVRAADARWLHTCLAGLTHEFREVLILREMEELSYREISAVVGVPIGTVMSRLSRGREQLARRVLAGPARKSS